MANINLSQKTYVDYVASLYFKAAKIDNLTLTPKVVTEENGTKTILIHVAGTQVTTGIRVNVDLWPRNNATEEDLNAMFKRLTHIEKDADGKEKEVFDGYGAPAISLSDLVFRVGYWPVVDENGDKTLAEGTPKWVSFFVGTEEKTLGGNQRVFGVENSNDAREE